MGNRRELRSVASLIRSTSSVTTRIRPWRMPALSNRMRACSRALARSLPNTGIMSGRSAGSRFSMVRVSSVSGTTGWASPA